MSLLSNKYLLYLVYFLLFLYFSPRSSCCSLSILLFYFLLAKWIYYLSCKTKFFFGDPCKTKLFEMLNYLFIWQTKLFRHVDSFVRDIYFSLFIMYKICTQCLIFCSLYIIICSVCLSFFHKNNYLFMLLNFLFPVTEINYLILKNIF